MPLAPTKKAKIVYIVGAGLSAGLGFPTIGDLLPKMWERLEFAGLTEKLSKVIRFHHPNFNPTLCDTYPNVEQLLSEMEANAQLFDSSRPATGNFKSEELEEQREDFLLELASWFLDLQAEALKKPPPWLSELVQKIDAEQGQVISFNWDLVLDQQLFGKELSRSSYGLSRSRVGPRLIKPHGSLNWYESSTGQFIKKSKKFSLAGTGSEEVFAFREYRFPKSSNTNLRSL